MGSRANQPDPSRMDLDAQVTANAGHADHLASEDPLLLLKEGLNLLVPRLTDSQNPVDFEFNICKLRLLIYDVIKDNLVGAKVEELSITTAFRLLDAALTHLPDILTHSAPFGVPRALPEDASAFSQVPVRRRVALAAGGTVADKPVNHADADADNEDDPPMPSPPFHIFFAGTLVTVLAQHRFAKLRPHAESLVVLVLETLADRADDPRALSDVFGGLVELVSGGFLARSGFPLVSQGVISYLRPMAPSLSPTDVVGKSIDSDSDSSDLPITLPMFTVAYRTFLHSLLGAEDFVDECKAAVRDSFHLPIAHISDLLSLLAGLLSSLSTSLDRLGPTVSNPSVTSLWNSIVALLNAFTTAGGRTGLEDAIAPALKCAVQLIQFQTPFSHPEVLPLVVRPALALSTSSIAMSANVASALSSLLRVVRKARLARSSPADAGLMDVLAAALTRTWSGRALEVAVEVADEVVALYLEECPRAGWEPGVEEVEALMRVIGEGRTVDVRRIVRVLGMVTGTQIKARRVTVAVERIGAQAVTAVRQSVKRPFQADGGREFADPGDGNRKRPRTDGASEAARDPVASEVIDVDAMDEEEEHAADVELPVDNMTSPVVGAREALSVVQRVFREARNVCGVEPHDKSSLSRLSRANPAVEIALLLAQNHGAEEDLVEAAMLASELALRLVSQAAETGSEEQGAQPGRELELCVSVFLDFVKRLSVELSSGAGEHGGQPKLESVPVQLQHLIIAVATLPLIQSDIQNDGASSDVAAPAPLMDVALAALGEATHPNLSVAEVKTKFNRRTDRLGPLVPQSFEALMSLPRGWHRDQEWRLPLLKRAFQGAYGERTRVLAWRKVPEAMDTFECSPAQFIRAMDPVLSVSATDAGEIHHAVASSVGRLLCGTVALGRPKPGATGALLAKDCGCCSADLNPVASHGTDGKTGPTMGASHYTFFDAASLRLFFDSAVTDAATKHSFAKASLPRILRHLDLIGYPGGLFVNPSDAKQQWIDVICSAVEGSDRSLRKIVGCRAYPILMEQASNESRVKMISRLSELVVTGAPPIQGSVVEIVGALAKRTDGAELLEGYLTCLVTQLSSDNIFIRALSFEQILGIAMAHKSTVETFCKPFLPQVANILVEKLPTHAKVVRDVVTKLLSQNIKDFLTGTLEYTLPVLLVKEQSAIIQEISRLTQTSVAIMCIEKTGEILHYIFMHTSDVERALNYFVEIARQEISDVEISSLLRSCLRVLVSKLVVELGDQLQRVRETARRALRIVEQYMRDKSSAKGPAEVFPKTSDPQLAAFMSTNFLGILSFLNDRVTNARGEFTVTYREKVVRGLVEVLKIVGTKVYMVAPQLMTTLRGALGSESLLDVAIEAWNVFVRILDLSKVAPLLSQIIVILTRRHERYSSNQLLSVVEILNFLVIAHQNDLKDYLGDVPALPDIPAFECFTAVMLTHRAQDEPAEQIRQILRGVAHENALVAEQALSELESALRRHQAWLQTAIVTDPIDPVVNMLMKGIMDAARRYDGTHDVIQQSCCKCLGLIGAADPARLDIDAVDRTDVVKSNFTDEEESLDFVCKLIEKHLVPAFRSPRNSRLQGHFAFCIQSLLRLCAFTPESVVLDEVRDKSGTGQSNVQVKRRWERFSKSCIETIQPLLDAKYLVNIVATAPCSYPLYPQKRTFSDWLQSWTLDLIEHKIDRASLAYEIFKVCRSVVKSDDLTVSLVVLPHLVLNVLLRGDQALCDEVLGEILTVLTESSSNVVGRERNSWSEEKRQRGSQIVFALVDYLSKWVRLRRQNIHKQRLANARRTGKANTGEDLLDTDEQIRLVDNVLSKIPQDMMALASYRCRSYERALLHLEKHIRNESGGKPETELASLYELCQRVYANMDEADAMEGVSTKFSSPSLEQQILEHESTGNWSAAQTCYELIIQEKPDSVDYQIGLINCLRNSGHFESLLAHVSGVASQHRDWSDRLNSFRAEAAWKLGKWDLLDQFVEPASEQSFEISIGRSLLAMRKGDEESLHSELRSMRKALTGPLVVASMESYQRAYEHVLKLHMVEEVQEWAEIWRNQESADELEVIRAIDVVVQRWDCRLNLASSSHKSLEPILSLRRTLLNAGNDQARLRNWQAVARKLDADCARAWLQSAKLARKSGYLSTAYSDILHATSLKAPHVYVERSKWLWGNGEQHRAIAELRGALGITTLDQVSSQQPSSMAAIDSKAQVLHTTPEAFLRVRSKIRLARWMEETNASNSNAILGIYGAAVKELEKWEKTYFFLGRYYLKLYENDKQKEASRKVGLNSSIYSTASLMSFVIKNYARALENGCKYIYQTLPRMLTLWFEFGTSAGLRDDTSNVTDERDKKFFISNKTIRRMVGGIPAYQFLTAFPQIVSRICHKNKHVFAVLEQMIVAVLSAYPQQALWQMISLTKSNHKQRTRRCEDIFSKVKSDPMSRHYNAVATEDLIDEFKKLTHELLNLCNHNVPPRETVLSINTDFRGLQRLTPTNIIVPLQSLLTVSLPSGSQAAGSHKPFPTEQPTIARFHDEVEIMSSLQRPRKITVTGSDRRDYIFLCKPKDDLRKDARLMEFNSMINKLLKKDPESRKRRLYIRSYSVVPLNEECGIIEWVKNTSGLRHILTKYYKAKNQGLMNQEIKETFTKIDRIDKEGKLAECVALYQTIANKFPPLFHEWYLDTFPEPRSWFSARLGYSRTTAVISMVGYILGLGDRHGENILFDETNGDCVHVDFNCLFEKGTTFERPERVPFRLTQNVVDGFGVTGVEGMFRKGCQVTLRVLRANQDSLMSVLETFIHDPLVEWTKGKYDKSGEVENELAVKSLNTIKNKLAGLVQAGLPLSIEGQVHEVISQAMDVKQLCRMYVGWAPFM